MELKFKNSRMINLFVALFVSGVVSFLFAFGFIFTSIVGQTDDNILALEIFGAIMLFIWIMYFICTFLIYKTIIVTDDKITVTRRKKILWSLNREGIYECVYQRLTVHNFYSPNAGDMLFKLDDTKEFAVRKLNKHFGTPYCISISYKNVKQMIGIG